MSRFASNCRFSSLVYFRFVSGKSIVPAKRSLTEEYTLQLAIQGAIPLWNPNTTSEEFGA